MNYSKAELRKIFSHLQSLLPPGAKPLNSAQIIEIGDLLLRTATLIETSMGRVERGAKVLEWRIETDFAPTMNELSSWLMRTKWRPKKAKDELCKQLLALIAVTPGADLCGAQKSRWVRVTRFTTQPKKIDDAAVDQIGGKLPIDMLKRCGVIVDDSPRWLVREASATKTKMGNTHVFVEVFEVAEDAVDTTEAAADGEAPEDARVYGPMTQAIVGEGTGPGPDKRPRHLPFGDG